MKELGRRVRGDKGEGMGKERVRGDKGEGMGKERVRGDRMGKKREGRTRDPFLLTDMVTSSNNMFNNS